MKTFVYRGYHRDGGRTKGVIEALDLKDAREKLSERNILPEQLTAAADGGTASSNDLFLSRNSLVRIQPRGEFYRAMSAMLKAGLPLVASLEVQLDQRHVHQGVVGREIASVRDRVRDGSNLVDALVNSGIAISTFEAAVIESGERTGTLHEVMEQLADYLEDVNRIRQTLRTACLYPAVIVLLALIVGAGVMGFLVPQMAKVFEESGMELPAITRFVIAAGRWFVPVILPSLLVGMAFAALAVRRSLSRTSGRIAWEKTIARLPVLRDGFQTLVALRFARTTSLLLQGGLPLVETIRLAGKATGSTWMASVCEEASESVKQGASFSNVMSGLPMLGAELGSWARAGEASGDLAAMFSHASNRLRHTWSASMDRVVTLIEPALIILVAVFVLVIALAILLPILSLNQQLV